jgi:hypothetical protein
MLLLTCESKGNDDDRQGPASAVPVRSDANCSQGLQALRVRPLSG